jgi:hypothetical protein
VRIETTRQTDAGTETTIEVINGNRRTHRDSEGHVEFEELNRLKGVTDSDRHFELDRIRQLCGGLSLRFAGNVSTAGRDCIRIRATKRPGQRLWPHWLPWEADEYEFHADCERAVLLGLLSRFAGEVFAIHEVQSISFDENLESTIFTYTPELGEQVRPTTPPVESMTLKEAAGRLPFAILIPTRGIDFDRAQRHTMYHSSTKGRPVFRIVYQVWASPDWTWIHESAFPDPSFNHFEWERLELNGKTVWVSDPGQAGGKCLLYLNQQGTYVTIHTNLQREQAIDLALSLEPASVPSKA